MSGERLAAEAKRLTDQLKKTAFSGTEDVDALKAAWKDYISLNEAVSSGGPLDVITIDQLRVIGEIIDNGGTNEGNSSTAMASALLRIDLGIKPGITGIFGELNSEEHEKLTLFAERMADVLIHKQAE